MPRFDISITITSILAVCAIISPILTAIINNRHNWRIRKLEMKREDYQNNVMYKRNIYENYLRAAGRCIYHSDIANLKEYGEHYLVALMCSESELRSKMIEINKDLRACEWDKASFNLELITPEIHNLLQKE